MWLELYSCEAFLCSIWSHSDRFVFLVSIKKNIPLIGLRFLVRCDIDIGDGKTLGSIANIFFKNIHLLMRFSGVLTWIINKIFGKRQQIEHNRLASKTDCHKYASLVVNFCSCEPYHLIEVHAVKSFDWLLMKTMQLKSV